MLDEILALTRRVQNLDQSVDISLASSILSDFEELASSQLSALLESALQEEEAIRSNKHPSFEAWTEAWSRRWVNRVHQIDVSLGETNGPDRPWTRVFWRHSHGVDYCHSEIAQDLRMIGAKLRPECVMDNLLHLYFAPFIRLGEPFNPNVSTDFLLESASGEIIQSWDIWEPASEGEEPEVDWGKVDLFNECIDYAIDVIIGEITRIAGKQWEAVCSWRLAEFLARVGQGHRLWRLFLEDMKTNGNVFSLGFRARLEAYYGTGAEFGALDNHEIEELEIALAFPAIDGSNLDSHADIALLPFIARSASSFRALATSVAALNDWAKDEVRRCGKHETASPLISAANLEEMRVVLLYSLYLNGLNSFALRGWPKFLGGLQEKTELRSAKANLHEILPELFESFSQICEHEPYRRYKQDLSFPFEFDPQDDRLTPMRKALPIIESADEFRKLLNDPDALLDVPDTKRFQLTEAESKEFGVPEGGDLRSLFCMAKQEVDELQDKLDHSDTARGALEGILEKCFRKDTDIARSELQELENYWYSRIREYYQSQGHADEQQMFTDLFSQIKKQEFWKKNQRGRIDGEFGEGKLFLSDINYFISLHWSNCFRSMFVEGTKPRNIRAQLQELASLRNQLSHPPSVRSDQSNAARRVLVLLEDFRKLLKSRE